MGVDPHHLESVIVAGFPARPDSPEQEKDTDIKEYDASINLSLYIKNVSTESNENDKTTDELLEAGEPPNAAESNPDGDDLANSKTAIPPEVLETLQAKRY